MPKLVTTPWRLHVSAWKDCRRCPLHSTRVKTVLARGQLPCDVLFIGEAPGASEDVLGTPFIGPAGNLLDAQIRDALQMSEREGKVRIAFTNLIACIPRGDDLKKVEEPSKACIEACRPRLEDLVKSVARPRKIVAVGALAARELRDFSIQILHPAAILRAGIEQRGLMIQRVVIALIELFEEM